MKLQKLIEIICSFIGFIGAEFEDVRRLAIKDGANCVQSAETDCFSLPGFEDGEICLSDANLVGKFAKRDFTLSHHHIEIYNYCHDAAVRL